MPCKTAPPQWTLVSLSAMNDGCPPQNPLARGFFCSSRTIRPFVTAESAGTNGRKHIPMKWPAASRVVNRNGSFTGQSQTSTQSS